jgi:hypothetical protein
LPELRWMWAGHGGLLSKTIIALDQVSGKVGQAPCVPRLAVPRRPPALVRPAKESPRTTVGPTTPQVYTYTLGVPPSHLPPCPSATGWMRSVSITLQRYRSSLVRCSLSAVPVTKLSADLREYEGSRERQQRISRPLLLIYTRLRRAGIFPFCVSSVTCVMCSVCCVLLCAPKGHTLIQ